MLEGSPAVVRDTYIDIFDVLAEDMKSGGLTEARAANYIRTMPHIKKAVKGGLDKFRTITTRSRAVSRFAGGLYGRPTVYEAGRT